MATEPTRRMSSGHASDLEPEERRSWLTSGIAALAVSALGLAVAGSLVLTANAETTAVDPPQGALSQTMPQTGPRTGSGSTATGAPAAAAAPQLSSFSRRSAEDDDESRTSVRSAVVEERAAQRSQDLTETAEDIEAAAVEAGRDARKAALTQQDRQRREAAVKAAQERTRKAIQARVTAEVQRELAEKQAAADQASTTAPDPDPAPEPTPTAPPQPDPGDVPSGGGSASPVPGAIVGASFGATGAWARYHTGLDFRAGFGTPIRAVTAGVVTFAGNKGNWAGNHVAIRHAGGYSSMSSHMQSMAVSAGQSVQAGQVIGYVGSTGRSFGAHLHFEVYPPGVNPGDVYQAINPIGWLRARGVNTN